MLNKVYCKNCKYYIEYNYCGIIGMTERVIKTHCSEKIESSLEKAVIEVYEKQEPNNPFAGLCDLEQISISKYNGRLDDTKVLNKNGNCKFYERKWWKFWVKQPIKFGLLRERLKSKPRIKNVQTKK